jgi:hypothetical protein
LTSQKTIGVRRNRIGPDPAVVDAEAAQGLMHVESEAVVANLGDDRRATPQAGGGDGHVGGAAAKVLAEGAHVGQAHPNLLRVEVHA